MPSLEQNRQWVQDQLLSRDAHDDILSSLQDEIDKHNAAQDEFRDAMRRHGRDDQGARKLRFKSRSARESTRVRKRLRVHSTHDPTSKTRSEEGSNAHPFPRKPVDLDQPPLTSDTAFREALFDALADDEGAQYWESVYNQPIHIYPRPSVAAPTGELERMTDEEYTTYVKTRMWEKKNPHIVHERERAERKRRAAEEARTREREEFVRRKQQAAWRREQTHYFRKHGEGDGQETRAGEDGDAEYRFTGHGNLAGESERQISTSAVFVTAWEHYFQAWEVLIKDLERERNHDKAETRSERRPASKRIPWPVIRSKAVTRSNMEDFFEHAPVDTHEKRLQLLKGERVRWHPDKVQQRFAGRVDEQTMKMVTSVFQTIDDLFEVQRKR